MNSFGSYDTICKIAEFMSDKSKAIFSRISKDTTRICKSHHTKIPINSYCYDKDIDKLLYSSNVCRVKKIKITYTDESTIASRAMTYLATRSNKNKKVTNDNDGMVVSNDIALNNSGMALNNSEMVLSNEMAISNDMALNSSEMTENSEMAMNKEMNQQNQMALNKDLAEDKNIMMQDILQNISHLMCINLSKSTPLYFSNTLKYISLESVGPDFYTPNILFPETLERLDISFEFAYNGEFNIPLKLKTLCMYKFNGLLNYSSTCLENLLFLNNSKGFLCDEYNKELHNLPKTLKVLWLSSVYDHAIDLENSRLVKLYVVNRQYKNALDKLPESLKHLTICCNSPIKYPKNLKIFEGLFDFDQSIDELPNSVTTIRLYGSFNKPINRLPTSLSKITEFKSRHIAPEIIDLAELDLPPIKKHIEFSLGGCTLDKKPFIIPLQTTKLTLSQPYMVDIFNKFSQELINLIELDVSYLYVQFNRTIDSIYIPPNLQSIDCPNSITFLNELPKSLAYLNISAIHKCNDNVLHFHENMREIKIGHLFNNIGITFSMQSTVLSHVYIDTYENIPDQKIQFPNSVSYINLGCTNNFEIAPLPTSLIELNLIESTKFNNTLGTLPSKLEKLFVGHDFNQSFNGFPDSLQILRLGGQFNQKLGKTNNLKSLMLSCENQIVDIEPLNSINVIIFATGKEYIYCHERKALVAQIN